MLLSREAAAVPAVRPFYIFFALLLVQLLHSVSVLRRTALPELPTLWCGGLELSAFELKELSLTQSRCWQDALFLFCECHERYG